MTAVLAKIDKHLGTDFDRLAQRRALRKEIGKLQMAMDHAAVLSEQIRGLDQREESAKAKHEAECLPLQEELRQIEEKLIDGFADQAAAEPALESKRRELLNGIAKANEVLQTESELIKRLREPIARKVSRLHVESAAIQVLKGKLTAGPLANPQLLDESKIAGSAASWAELRLADARAKCAGAESLAQSESDDDNRAIYEERARVWRLEQAAAQSAFFAAQRTQDDLQARMANE